MKGKSLKEFFIEFHKNPNELDSCCNDDNSEVTDNQFNNVSLNIKDNFFALERNPEDEKTQNDFILYLYELSLKNSVEYLKEENGGKSPSLKSNKIIAELIKAFEVIPDESFCNNYKSIQNILNIEAFQAITSNDIEKQEKKLYELEKEENFGSIQNVTYEKWLKETKYTAFQAIILAINSHYSSLNSKKIMTANNAIFLEKKQKMKLTKAIAFFVTICSGLLSFICQQFNLAAQCFSLFECNKISYFIKAN